MKCFVIILIDFKKRVDFMNNKLGVSFSKLVLIQKEIVNTKLKVLNEFITFNKDELESAQAFFDGDELNLDTCFEEIVADG